MKGYIVKGIGGFYYVKTEEGVIECKPRGIFRKQKITPVAGDEVTLETENGAAVIAEIAPRKNVFVRPPVANLDVLFLVASTTQPTPSTLVLDKLSAIAVDKGVQETMKDGIIAGYPLTGIRVAVYDGSYHSVDSNEMAFRAAARIGLRKACADADPVVLEPIEEITVTIPESYAGAVMGDISASRGRVTGMETDERGDTVVIAQAPLAELADYSTRLRSITRGTGDFTMKPAGYEQVPYDVQAKLVERYEEGRAK